VVERFSRARENTSRREEEMAKLHHAAMEELAGTLAGLSDVCGGLEFEQYPNGNYAARTEIDTGNLEVELTVYTNADATGNSRRAR
jgi:hypothetical protein